MKKLTLYTLLVALLSLAAFYVWKSWTPKAIEMKLKPVSYSHLPGWGKKDLRPSFSAFQASCKIFLKSSPDKKVGSDIIDLKARDWFPACKSALAEDAPKTSEKIREFFQHWLEVVEFDDGHPVEGLFTGYYMSSLKGSLKKSEKFNVPVYGLPDDLVSAHLSLFDPSLQRKKIIGRVVHKHQFVPYYTRAEIDEGALKGKAPVIAWVDSKIDRLFMEIQGSGVIELDNGKSLYVNYAAQNGAPYTPIASVLIKKGVMTKDNASMQHIRSYLESHPKEIKPVLNKNKSFVFFEKLNKHAAYGSQGTELTPGYSMAVDLKWVPVGTPVWLTTHRPDEHVIDKKRPFQRLMVAQDTGGAIRGPVRGDIYWGAGKKATAIAGRMKHPGQYWLLLPKNVLNSITHN